MTTSTETSKKYAVLDTTGKVKDWLANGRGLRVWTSQEIGVARGDILTPGDNTVEPHWAYRNGDRLLGSDDVVFFLKDGVAHDSKMRRIEFSDSPSGYRACEKALATLPRDNAPWPNLMAYQYTIERVTYRTDEVREDGRPLGLDSRVAVIRWVAHIGKGE